MPSDDLASLRRQAQGLALKAEWGEFAIQVNTRMLEIDDHAADAYTRLARCFREQGRLRAALEMYAQVLSFEPANAIARNNSEEIERKIGRVDELRAIDSIKDYEEAFAVGIAASRSSRFTLAVAALSRAVELQPASVYAWNALGSANRHSGSLAAAVSAYEHAYALRSNQVSMVGLAAVARDQSQYARAEELYSRVLKAERTNTFALNGLAGVYIDTGRLGEAEACFQSAAQVAAGNADTIKGLDMLRRQYELHGDTVATERVVSWLRRFAG